MILTYNLSEEGKLLSPARKKELIKSCDIGFNAQRDLLISIAKILHGRWAQYMVWFVTRFYKKTVTDDSVSYKLYFIGE